MMGALISEILPGSPERRIGCTRRPLLWEPKEEGIYADLVIHGSIENNEDSEDSDEEMTNEGESYDEGESGMTEEMFDWSQAQREAYRRVRKEERAIPSIT
ncbi:hypothetical protein S245_005847, partial [Arachis hypogaea]